VYCDDIDDSLTSYTTCTMYMMLIYIMHIMLQCTFTHIQVAPESSTSWNIHLGEPPRS